MVIKALLIPENNIGGELIIDTIVRSTVLPSADNAVKAWKAQFRAKDLPTSTQSVGLQIKSPFPCWRSAELMGKRQRPWTVVRVRQ